MLYGSTRRQAASAGIRIGYRLVIVRQMARLVVRMRMRRLERIRHRIVDGRRIGRAMGVDGKRRR